MPPAAPAGAQGTWLFDSFKKAPGRPGSDTMSVWNSSVTVEGDRFTLKRVLNSDKHLTGTLKFDAKHPGHVDLVVDDFGEVPFTGGVAIAAGVRRGVYKLDGDDLTVSFARFREGARPATIDGPAEAAWRVTLKRAPGKLTGVPETVEVTATGPDGKPAAGVELRGELTFRDTTTKPEFVPVAVTDAAGRAKIPFDVRGGVLVAYDPKHKQIAYVGVTPIGLASGPLAVKLAPWREVAVPVECPGLPPGTALGLNGTISNPKHRLAYTFPQSNTLRFLLPPGEYVVGISSAKTNAVSGPLTVPPGEGVFTAPTTTLKPNPALLIVGKPAPELEGVTASRGGSVKLADYKGKYVVLDFWGYWCPPCVSGMPKWFAVHDHFMGEKVAVIAVHRDSEGEVATLAQYDARVKPIVADAWKGRDLPFPVALVRGGDEDEAAYRLYGVAQYPTAVLIGPDGKVIGQVTYRDAKEAIAALEKLLEKK